MERNGLLSHMILLELKRILMEWQVGMDKGNGWNAIFWCNHDQPRIVSRFGSDVTEEKRVLSAKMLAISLHGLKGTPYIYQGEEIGMTNPHFSRIDQYRDVESLNAYQTLREEGIGFREILDILSEKSRDNARTPMQWDDSRNAGFTDGVPWIDISDNYQAINTRQALEDQDSIFYTYQKLIELRHDLDIITYGDIIPFLMNDENIFMYKRQLDGKVLTAIANYSDNTISYPAGVNLEGKVLISNYKDASEMLRPFEAKLLYSEE
jgi:trehalose-6-phosphate hydrolase